MAVPKGIAPSSITDSLPGRSLLLKEGGILTSMNPDTGEVTKHARLTGALDQWKTLKRKGR